MSLIDEANLRTLEDVLDEFVEAYSLSYDEAYGVLVQALKTGKGIEQVINDTIRQTTPGKD